MNSLDNVAPRALREESAKHNGWTNYATWRVNLEIFDGLTLEDLNTVEVEPYEVSKYLKDYATELVSGNDLATDYALAFMSDVNWYEIAEHIIENSKETAE
jgi:hypothetical protein